MMKKNAFILHEKYLLFNMITFLLKPVFLHKSQIYAVNISANDYVLGYGLIDQAS